MVDFCFSSFMKELARKQQEAKHISQKIMERFEGYVEISLKPYALFKKKGFDELFYKEIPRGKNLSDFQRVGAEVSLVLLGQGDAYREIRELIVDEELGGPLDKVFSIISAASDIILGE